MATSNLITIRDLHHHYTQGHENCHILHQLNWSVQAGQRIAIMGPSGCGKSTLLNLIAGLIPIQQGHIDIDGQDLSILNNDERCTFRSQNIGLINQSFALIEDLSCIEYVHLILALLERQHQEESTLAMLGALGLNQQKKQNVQSLSGGQQQRLAIATALLLKPKLILADEPTGNLDQTRSDQVIALLTTYCHKHHITLIMATHDQRMADACDAVYIFRDQQLKLS